MNLGDFMTDLTTIVNESSDLDALLRAAVERAVKGIERRVSFEYMREIYYGQLLMAGQLAVVDVIEVTAGATDLQISNPSGGGGVGVDDGLISIASLSTPIYTELAVGDWVEFDGEISAHYATLDGTYGQVTQVTLGTFGGSIVVAIADETPYSIAEMQPIGFQLKKLNQNPYMVSTADPGLFSVGAGYKHIEQMDLCDNQDYRKVITRGIRKYNWRETDPQMESWDNPAAASAPTGYYHLGLARKLSPKMVGDRNFPGNYDMFLVRPVPDKAYWLRADMYRYSIWERDNDEYEHFLLDNHSDWLIAAAIAEAGPGLRDQDLLTAYSAISAQKTQDLVNANTAKEDGNSNERMAYDPRFSDR